MGGFVDSVGDGITGLVAGAFDVIGDTLRGLVNAGNQALPGGMLFVVAFIVAVIGAWTLAKR
jgi:hypothetical protein